MYHNSNDVIQSLDIQILVYTDFYCGSRGMVFRQIQ